MPTRRRLAALAGALALLLCASSATAAAPVTEAEAFEIGVEAYHYLYPLVLMDVTRLVTTSVPEGAKPGFGPAGKFHHMRTYPSVQFREVVRPNFDTLYSVAWFNVAKEPWIVSVPDTQGRFYVMPIYDMWTDAFAVPGKRTSGTGAGHFAIVPRGWKGKLPAGVERIEAPTPWCWIIVRTQTNGPKDYEAVHQVQDGYKLTPLSRWGNAPNVVVAKAAMDPAVDTKTEPLVQVANMPADKFFAYAASLMKDNPPHLTDWSILARMKRIGLEPGKPFDLARADPGVRAALERVPTEALQRMKDKYPTMARVANGWQMNTDTMGVYGNYYLKRAIIGLIGLGANQEQDAVYPLNVGDAEGQPMVGERKYVMHFAKDQLPPAGAFWSITMYDAEGFQAANPIDRYAIGDRDALRYNDDGSLDIYIQHDSPGAVRESNWLPAPLGKLGITMRLYAPRAEALDGRWAPPRVQPAP